MKKLWTLLAVTLFVLLLGAAAQADVLLPPGLTEIDDYAFQYDESLSGHLEIPYGVTRIGDYAFYRCSNITSVTIPDSVTEIGNYAFSDCTSLTMVTIPNSVTEIGEFAFRYCTGLTTVTIPDSVAVIGRAVFSHCTGLTTVTIPDSVTSIGKDAFSDCTGLTSVNIPEGVTSIGQFAFENCSSLTSITIPDSVPEIGEWVFFGCTALKSITLSENTKVSNYALYNTAWMWDQAQAVVDSVTTSSQTEFEKMLALHDWMTRTNRYDLTYTYHSPDTMFLYHTGVCSGYARTFSLLLKLVGIEVQNIDGETINSRGSAGHEWNLVKLDGDWYHVDCTWDDPLVNGQDTEGYHDYCCVPDSVMQEDHTWDAEDYPAATGTKYFRGEKVE